MNYNKWLLLGLFFCIVTGYAVTIDDVQKLDIHTFFNAWSQFLDQVLKAQQELMSDADKAIYQEFINQANTLNLSKVTGNEKILSDMQQQTNAIKKRISDEKKFFAEWAQFCESVLNAKEYPMSPEAEQAYQRLVKEARYLHIEQSRIDEMHAKMNEISDTLFQENEKRDPEVQLSRLNELEKNVKEIKEKINSEEKPAQGISEKGDNV